MESHVTPRRRRLNRTGELLLLVQAHRDVVLPQRREHSLIEPALVPELDREAAVRRKQAEKTAQPLYVLLHVRRQLEQNRTQPLTEDASILEQKIQRARARGLEPRVVRDAHARLDR